MLINETPLSSAYKVAYFVIFVATAVDVVRNLIGNYSALGKTLGIVSESTNDHTVSVLYACFCVTFLFHIIRVYLTMEFLEDPSTNLHKDFVHKYDKKMRFWEQAIRYCIILTVSIYFVHVFGANASHTQISIKTISLFLVVLYFFLLCWDCHALLAMQGSKSKRTLKVLPFISCDAIGFILNSCILWVLVKPKDAENLFSILIFMYISILCISLVVSIITIRIDYDNRKFKCLVNNDLKNWTRHTWSGIKAPHYGD